MANNSYNNQSDASSKQNPKKRSLDPNDQLSSFPKIGISSNSSPSFNETWPSPLKNPCLDSNAPRFRLQKVLNKRHYFIDGLGAAVPLHFVSNTKKSNNLQFQSTPSKPDSVVVETCLSNFLSPVELRSSKLTSQVNFHSVEDLAKSSSSPEAEPSSSISSTESHVQAQETTCSSSGYGSGLSFNESLRNFSQSLFGSLKNDDDFQYKVKRNFQSFICYC